MTLSSHCNSAVIGLNVITEFVAGFILPGRPLANVTFKVRMKPCPGNGLAQLIKSSRTHRFLAI